MLSLYTLYSVLFQKEEEGFVVVRFATERRQTTCRRQDRVFVVSFRTLNAVRKSFRAKWWSVVSDCLSFWCGDAHDEDNIVCKLCNFGQFDATLRYILQRRHRNRFFDRAFLHHLSLSLSFVLHMYLFE